MKTVLHDCVAEFVPQNARVLDLGCGSGELLAKLKLQKNCSGYGVEIDDENVLRCVEKGLQVIQMNLEQGLAMIEDNAFDVVLQINTLQNLRNTETMLRETARVGHTAVVAFPNFAHWPNRISILRGRMPVTKTLPYEWYDTPNIRVGTFADFRELAVKNGLRVVDAFGLDAHGLVRLMPNFRASTALFLLERA